MSKLKWFGFAASFILTLLIMSVGFAPLEQLDSSDESTVRLFVAWMVVVCFVWGRWSNQ